MQARPSPAPHELLLQTTTASRLRPAGATTPTHQLTPGIAIPKIKFRSLSHIRYFSGERFQESMPLYEYECKKCHHRFERIVKFSDRPMKKCPDCGGPVEQTITAPAVQFKGSGWYVTDYPKKPSASASPSNGDSKSKDEAASKKESASKEESTSKKEEKSSKPPEKTKSETSSKKAEKM